MLYKKLILLIVLLILILLFQLIMMKESFCATKKCEKSNECIDGMECKNNCCTILK
jgi:hypothetical protein